MKLALAISFPILEQVASPNFIGSDLGDIVNKLILYLFPLAGLAMLLFLLYGGFKYMLSRGDPKALADARGTITTAIVGFIIVFVSFWLVQIIGYVLGIPQISVIFGTP